MLLNAEVALSNSDRCDQSICCTSQARTLVRFSCVGDLGIPRSSTSCHLSDLIFWRIDVPRHARPSMVARRSRLRM